MSQKCEKFKWMNNRTVCMLRTKSWIRGNLKVRSCEKHFRSNGTKNCHQKMTKNKLQATLKYSLKVIKMFPNFNSKPKFGINLLKTSVDNCCINWITVTSQKFQLLVTKSSGCQENKVKVVQGCPGLYEIFNGFLNL